MERNMGTTDRFLRASLGIVVGILIATGQLHGVAALVLGLFAVVFVATSLVGFCPLYKPLKISTCKKTRT